MVVHLEAAAELFGGGQAELALANPIAADLSDMRPSLLPGLVAAAQANIDRGFPDLALFEVGQIFKGDRPEDQLIAASGVRHGFASSKGIGRHWSGSATADALDAKADAFAVLAAAGAPMQALQIVPGGPSWLHPGRSGTIQIGPQNMLGYFGELHPRALEALGADGPLIAFEVILDRIPDAKQKPTRAKPVLELSPFQPVSRDFAFIVDRSVKAGDIVRAAQGVDKKLITAVTVFDVYEGKGIDDGKKSIAIAVTIQPREKTLTDQEIDAVAAKIVAEVDEEDRRRVALISRRHPEVRALARLERNCVHPGMTHRSQRIPAPFRHAGIQFAGALDLAGAARRRLLCRRRCRSSSHP